ncbi:ornithine decarboxylase [Trichonephila clavata]|uniref:Ornithine decarboxylase n=1 Tax=Trichonephila clavata TaxID=2740835 RepID=A0A8X6G5K1_TRICU|nr:ornithine decarboxylase [Trichonephila clavata]
MDVEKDFANDTIRNRNIFDYLLLKSSENAAKLLKLIYFSEAVKANADPVLMRLFVLLEYGFDCSTEGEIRLALKSGADPKKIIFAHTIKVRKALKYASSVGVDLMTFDCKEELLKINQDFPTARLILRLKSESKKSVYNLNKKFGCDLSEVENLLLRAKNLNLNVVGVSFHVGALCESSETFVSAIENSRLVFSLAERHGFKFTILDIGSGFFGSKEKESFFYELTQEIKTSLEKNFPTEDIEIIAEPGCYCVASAFSLVTSIIGKKSIAQNGNNGLQKEYYLNDGFYGSFPYFYKDYDVKHVPLLKNKDRVKPIIETSTVAGAQMNNSAVADEEQTIALQ